MGGDDKRGVDEDEPTQKEQIQGVSNDVAAVADDVKTLLEGPLPSERMAVVETDVKHILRLLQGHIAQPSCQECKLGDDMAVCQNDVRWMKRIGYSTGALSLSTLVALLLDHFLRA